MAQYIDSWYETAFYFITPAFSKLLDIYLKYEDKLANMVTPVCKGEQKEVIIEIPEELRDIPIMNYIYNLLTNVNTEKDTLETIRPSNVVIFPYINLARGILNKIVPYVECKIIGDNKARCDIGRLFEYIEIEIIDKYKIKFTYERV